MSGVGKKEEEEDCSAAFKKPACPPCQHVTHPLVARLPYGKLKVALFIVKPVLHERYYEFTQDEIKALEECDKESFYQRCLPFSTLFASITYAAIKYGIMQRSPHYGATPKVLLAGMMGHIVGRLSYLPLCDQKLREDLDDKSYLGNLMRKYYKDAHPEPEKK